MPPRLFLLILIGAAAALVLLGAAVGGWERPSQPRLHPAGPVAYHHHRPPPPSPPSPRIAQPMIAPDDAGPTFPVVSLREAVRVASGRYRGRVIGAALLRPRPEEAARGVQLVYVLRLLTPEQDLLLVRIDARDASFLEAAGNDLVRARRGTGKD